MGHNRAVTARWLRAVLWAQLRSVRSIVWACVLALAALSMAFVPVLNVLGFGFALFMAFLGSLAAADLGAAFVRRARDRHRDGLERADRPGRSLALLWSAAAAANLALLLPPLVIISVNALRVRNCDWAFGFESYLLVAGLSSLAGTSTGVVCAMIAGPRRRWSNALPYLAVALSAARAVGRFYSEPPIFLYNAYIGYWPGTPYDESIALGEAFYWSRALQLAVAVAALALCAVALDVPSLTLRLRRELRPAGRRLAPVATAVVSALIAGSLWADSGDLGFAVDAGEIQRALGGRYQTDNFVIYYPRGSEIADRIEGIAADHEYRLAQVSQFLDARPGGRITSYYFPDPETKARWTGARRVHVAKPWRREIYVDHQAFPHRVLRHEIAHVVAAEFGDPVFRVSVQSRLGLPLAFNPGLIEGLAVAADWPDRRGGTLTPHQSVKVLFELGMAPPIDKVLSPQFLAFASSRSYTLAGSFVRFIYDRYGVDRVRSLYRTGGDFMTSLGRRQTDVIAEWRQMIDAIELPPNAADRIREAFRRPGILSRACPIAIARRRQRASDLVGEGRLEAAIGEMRRVCRDAPGEPGDQLTLALLLSRAGQPDEASAIRRRIAADDEGVSTTLRARALGDMIGPAVHGGDLAGARDLVARAGAMTLPEGEARANAAHRLALDHPGPAGPALRRYFWGAALHERGRRAVRIARAAEVVRLEPDLALGHYLFGFNLADTLATVEAASALSRALDLGLPDPRLTREAARRLARVGYLSGDDEAVVRAVGILDADGQPEAVRLRARDWIMRMAWRRTGELPSPR